MAMSLKILVQYLSPQHALSRVFGCLAEIRWPWFKNWAIKRLIRKYHVNLSEALVDDVTAYPTFNSFFTRLLKPELRPIVQGVNEIACPADGSVSQIGTIDNDAIFQAKGFYFSLTTLLGNSSELAEQFRNGCFATVYLAPKDYHRVHMPLSGILRTTIYVPGDLFSVNTYTSQCVPNLFSRNERLICIFDTAIGSMAVILVGAMLVGSIHAAWETKHNTREISVQHYSEKVVLERGADMGHFKMGSTVIVLFSKDKMNWNPTLQEGSGVKMGQLMGHVVV